MLSKADVDLRLPMTDLASYGVEAGYLVPTTTGLNKSILDAHESLRDYLARSNLHSYSSQGQGPDSKVVIESLFLTRDGWVPCPASLYRPNTKNGDPRIWFAGLRGLVSPNNLLVLLAHGGVIYVINASDKNLWGSLRSQSSHFGVLISKIRANLQSAQELLIEKIRLISEDRHRSTTNADSGVGDTLERLLGISRNSNKAPDFHGIEIKAKRIGGRGGKGPTGKTSLFSLSPNWEISACKNALEILDAVGYVSQSTGRRALQVTVSTSKNAQGLYFDTREDAALVRTLVQQESLDREIVSWRRSDLEEALAHKHAITCWVGAKSEVENDWEYFRYIRAEITPAPLISNFGPLVETGQITMDFTITEKVGPAGLRTRDHGYLWRVSEANRKALFPPGRLVEF